MKAPEETAYVSLSISSQNYTPSFCKIPFVGLYKKSQKFKLNPTHSNVIHTLHDAETEPYPFSPEQILVQETVMIWNKLQRNLKLLFVNIFQYREKSHFSMQSGINAQ